MNNSPNNGAPRPAAPKVWTLTHEGFRATIRFEPREKRKAYRVEWTADGQDRSEMFASRDEAQTNAWAKLMALASGERTLTQLELEALLAFKSKYEALQDSLKATGQSLDTAISDLVAARDSLPGWRPTQMADFLVENHLVKKPMKVRKVVAAFLNYRKSGQERDYDRDTLTYDAFRLEEFSAAFGELEIHVVTGRDILRFISNYKVGPTGLRRLANFDPRLLRPASQATKRSLFNILNCLFTFAKKHLRALRPHAHTVLERLDSPQFLLPSKQFYSSSELTALMAVLPDVESLIYTGMQAFSSLGEAQASRVDAKDIVLRSAGVEPHILVTEELGRKDPLTGEVRTRTIMAPITPPLEALFAQTRLPRGPLIQSKSIQYKVRRAAREAGLLWKPRGFRNAFLAHRLGAGYSLEEVAYEAGIVFLRDLKGFVGLVEDGEARAYWRVKINRGNRSYTSARISWQAKNP